MKEAVLKSMLRDGAITLSQFNSLSGNTGAVAKKVDVSTSTRIAVAANARDKDEIDVETIEAEARRKFPDKMPVSKHLQDALKAHEKSRNIGKFIEDDPFPSGCVE